MTHCRRGHPLVRPNLYVHRKKRHCRICRHDRPAPHYITADELVEREIAWLIDLPNIIDTADRVCG